MSVTSVASIELYTLRSTVQSIVVSLQSWLALGTRARDAGHS